jgi:hypothetical protein
MACKAVIRVGEEVSFSSLANFSSEVTANATLPNPSGKSQSC